MLLRRPLVALGLEVFQRLGQVPARVGRLDDVVDQAAAGRDVGRRERGAVLARSARRGGRPCPRPRSISLRKTISTAPSAPITATSAVGQAKTRSAPRSSRAHRQVGAAVGLAQDHLDLRHGRRRVGEQQLGAVADDAAVLLLHARQEARHVDEGDQRDVERVAEADEPAGLGRGVDVDRARQHRRLVGDDADRSGRGSGRSRRPCSWRGRPATSRKSPPIDDAADHVADVVALLGLDRHDVVQRGVGVDVVVGRAAAAAPRGCSTAGS